MLHVNLGNTTSAPCCCEAYCFEDLLAETCSVYCCPAPTNAYIGALRPSLKSIGVLRGHGAMQAPHCRTSTRVYCAFSCVGPPSGNDLSLYSGYAHRVVFDSQPHIFASQLKNRVYICFKQVIGIALLRGTCTTNAL